MDDDAVLLADDEDMGALTASTLDSSPPPGDLGTSAVSPPDDMVLVDDAEVLQPAAQHSTAAAEAAGAGSAPASSGDVAMADAAAEAAAAPAAPVEVPAVSSNPFAAASVLPQPGSSADGEVGSAADASTPGVAASDGPAESEEASSQPAADDTPAATVTVEKAQGKDSSSKRQAMASHPVEVPEELS
jgi:hypothetical protein